MLVNYSGMLALPPTRRQIEALQAEMLRVQCEMPKEVNHFANGMYAREFSMPAGMTVVGKIHKHQHFMMVLKGRATVVTEFGRQAVSAGFVHVSQAGAKRVVFAHEDTTFVTVHLNPSNTQEISEIESAHIEPESLEMQELINSCRKELL